MALSYIYKKYKDTYTIENTGITLINYEIQTKECDSFKLYKTGKILVGDTLTLPITKIDGVYSVRLFDDTEEQTLDDILQYNNTLLNFIDGVEESICGCKKCKDCEECNTCNDYLNTLNYGLSFLHVNTPKYNDYLDIISETLKCNYTQEVICSILHGTVSGIKDTIKLTSLNSANLYLAFYFFDIGQAFDSEEANYIREKYKYAKITKCIRKLGIDIDDFNEQIFVDMQVYYWQLTNTQDDIDDVIPLINSIYLNTKPSLPFSEFEDGEIVSYSDIGRIVFAIKDTDLINFTVSDSLNNDITDEFDTEYIGDINTALFVSKNPMSISNIYFKFKKLTYIP